MSRIEDYLSDNIEYYEIVKINSTNKALVIQLYTGNYQEITIDEYGNPSVQTVGDNSNSNNR